MVFTPRFFNEHDVTSIRVELLRNCINENNCNPPLLSECAFEQMR